MALNSWQKIDRVITGKPFGDGVDGAYSSATIPAVNSKSCSGTAGATTLTASTSSAYSVGDVILIHQSRGTGVGQWEINRIASVGSGSYGLQEPLKYKYTDSGDSQAQVIKVPRYTNVTIPSGTWNTTAWDGNIGGLFSLMANGTLTVSSTLSAIGSAATTTTPGSGKGFRGGAASFGPDDSYGDARQGEGTPGVGVASRNANGNGGGAAYKAYNDLASGGGGGGHASAGSSGVDASGGGGGNSLNGLGGSAVGTSDLTSLFFGGGGGGANAYGPGGAGGGGGAIVVLFAKEIAEITGSINASGGAGGNGSGANGSGGGGGAGGSILIACERATLGTTKVTATGGAGGLKTGGTNGNGGAGSVGRIAVHHSGTVTGTTSPTFSDITDTSLVESSADAIFFGTNF